MKKNAEGNSPSYLLIAGDNCTPNVLNHTAGLKYGCEYSPLKVSETWSSGHTAGQMQIEMCLAAILVLSVPGYLDKN